jgi:hypothetical protein
MKDLRARLEKLKVEAEDCELIGRLATDRDNRELYEKQALDLRAMAREVQTLIDTYPPE